MTPKPPVQKVRKAWALLKECGCVELAGITKDFWKDTYESLDDGEKIIPCTITYNVIQSRHGK